MDLNLEHQLREDFPFLYPPLGIGVRNGWYKIVREIFEEITKCNKLLPDDQRIKIDQIKQKFAELRVYLRTSTTKSSPIHDTLKFIIDNAVDKASRTCEICGNIGRKRTENIWLSILCENCNRREEGHGEQY